MFSWLEYPVVMDIRPSLSTRSPSVTREPLFSRSRSSLSSRMLLPNCSPRQPNHFFHCRRQRLCRLRRFSRSQRGEHCRSHIHQRPTLVHLKRLHQRFTLLPLCQLPL